jgi:hypothetical protein
MPVIFVITLTTAVVFSFGSAPGRNLEGARHLSPWETTATNYRPPDTEDPNDAPMSMDSSPAGKPPARGGIPPEGTAAAIGAWGSGSAKSPILLDFGALAVFASLGVLGTCICILGILFLRRDWAAVADVSGATERRKGSA